MKRRLPVLAIMLLLASPIRAQLQFTETDIPVRDGNALKADLYIGDGAAAKPVILIQTPYNKLLYRFSLGRKESTFPLDTNSYHYVFVDWRGFYASKDAAVAGYDRGLDGYDIVEWIATQAWCNGKVGTYGGSALGAIQFQTARHHPPHLVCAAPSIIDYRTEYSDYYFHGVLRYEHTGTLERLGFYPPGTITARPVENTYWDFVKTQTDYPEDIAVPLLMCSGWFDHYPAAVLRAFADLRERSAEPVRNSHKMIMGPWSHSEVDLEEQGDLSFPNAARYFYDAALQFFAYHLLGAKNGWPLLPAVRYYQMGEDSWKSLDGWDLRSRIPFALHLHSSRTLHPEAPATDGALSLRYDPRDPSPSIGAARFNPFDASAKPGPLDISDAVESREDARLFTSSELTTPVVTAGPVEVAVTLSSDRTDTDIAVRLCDVHPDGRSIILSDGIRRMRFRDGTRSESALTPGVPYTTGITLPDIAHTFLSGHRIRVVLTSSNWPRFDRNLNNGGSMYTEGDTLFASNTLHFGPASPAVITFQLSSPLSSAAQPGVGGMHGILNVFPQPFAQTGSGLQFELSTTTTSTRLQIVDALGRTVASFPGSTASGRTDITWNGLDTFGHRATTGLYIARLHDGPQVFHRAFLVVK